MDEVRLVVAGRGVKPISARALGRGVSFSSHGCAPAEDALHKAAVTFGSQRWLEQPLNKRCFGAASTLHHSLLLLPRPNSVTLDWQPTWKEKDGQKTTRAVSKRRKSVRLENEWVIIFTPSSHSILEAPFHFNTNQKPSRHGFIKNVLVSFHFPSKVKPSRKHDIFMNYNHLGPRTKWLVWNSKAAWSIITVNDFLPFYLLIPWK
jgi:hypothetical protein